MQSHWKRSGFFFAIALGLGIGTATAADYSTPAPKTPAQDAGKAMAPATGARMAAPSKAETADAAFKKLDSTAKGYVTKDDAKSLSGFDKAFQDNDANHDGRLTSAEFAKAWQEFTGNKS
jgi:hypothetical protein